MNETEQEAIILNTAWDMIDNMVNWAMIVPFKEPLCEVRFATQQHAQLFNVLLGDFLSQVQAFNGKPQPLGLPPTPSSARESDRTFLLYLRQICAAPRLGQDVEGLRLAVEAFADWLEVEFVATAVWLPEIKVQADIRIMRWRYLKMCGDIGKHHIARLEANAGHLRGLLAACGHTISEQDSYLAIPDFYEWFHTNIFVAHASVIADFLNNIRIAIHAYLQPEYARAFVRTDWPAEGQYHFDLPVAIKQPVAHAMYWEAMNRVRAGLYMQRFAVPDILKALY